MKTQRTSSAVSTFVSCIALGLVLGACPAPEEPPPEGTPRLILFLTVPTLAARLDLPPFEMVSGEARWPPAHVQ